MDRTRCVSTSELAGMVGRVVRELPDTGTVYITRHDKPQAALIEWGIFMELLAAARLSGQWEEDTRVFDGPLPYEAR